MSQIVAVFALRELIELSGFDCAVTSKRAGFPVSADSLIAAAREVFADLLAAAGDLVLEAADKRSVTDASLDSNPDR